MNIKSIKKIIIALSLLFSGQVFSVAITTSGPSSVNTNDIFTVDIIGTGFLDNVDGGGINVSFDQNVFNVLSVSIDESVWNFGAAGISTGSIDNTTGYIDGIMVNTFADVSGDFVIATLEIQAMSEGMSSLLLSELSYNPWASGGSRINPDFTTNPINIVSAVPVPAAAWLFGSGLLGLVAAARRKI